MTTDYRDLTLIVHNLLYLKLNIYESLRILIDLK